MGLAPYGNPDSDESKSFEKIIRDELVDIRDDGSFLLNMDYFSFATGLTMCPEDKLIQDMAKGMGVHEVRFKKEDKDCILCGLCGRVCDEVVGSHAIQFAFRGDRREMIPPFLGEAMNCIACGACVIACPVDVIKMKEEGDERTIIRWKRTLKMKKCKVCGNYFAPWFQLEKFKEQAKLPKDFFDICYTCRT
jgi:formate hydrogenlyase subunit 6/NADH:ubiquinone oxidoreductase subunit I